MRSQSTRWLGYIVVLVWVAWARAAHAAPVLELDPTALAFNDVAVGSSLSRTVTLTNSGDAELSVTAFTKTGAQSAAYTFTGTCPPSCTIAAGASKTLIVTFAPTTAVQSDISIGLASNGGNASIAVTGRGFASQIDPPGPLAFGDVDVGATSGGLMLVVGNTGNAPLTITNAQFSQGDPDYDATTGTLGPQTTVVQPGATTAWTIVCAPTTHGARPGQFRITSNTQSGGPDTNVALSCAGHQGKLVITAPVPPTLAFGNVTEGDVASLPFTLKNEGDTAVGNLAAAFNPANVGYTIDPATTVPTTLAAGASVTLRVRFAPLAGMAGGPATLTLAGTWGGAMRPTSAVVNITGSGLVASFEVTAAAIAFGELRFDAQPTRTFCIRNNGAADVPIVSLPIAPAAGTTSGEFAVVGIRKPASNSCVAGGPVVALPNTLTAGQVLEITVRADPANRTGAMAATLTATANIPANATHTVALTGTSTSAALALAPGMALDFGAVDVQAGPVLQMFTITNTGDGPLDLSGFTRTPDAQFTISLPPGATTLEPGMALPIAVSYDPDVASPVGAEEAVTINHAITGVLNGPAAQMLSVRGRGIDRQLELGPAPIFPDTFRNPGDDAPVRPVRVTNLGEAPLAVTAAMISNDPEVWELVDPAPVTIPGGASHEFLVRFVPRQSGRAPDARLVLTNDDDQRPMVEVALTGSGLNRQVMFAPDTIRLGFTGIGVPVTIPDVLEVTSLDATTSYTIARIELDEGSPFQIVGATDVELPAKGTKVFGVTFTPERPGQFRARAFLYLDQDPDAQHAIDIEGTAVFVDAHGGGGCAAGGGGGGLLAGLAGVLLVVAQRRRRRAAVVAAAVALAPAAAAQADNVVLSVFDPAPATVSNGFQLASPEVGPHNAWVMSAVVSLATKPLVLDAIGDGQVINDAGVITRSTLLDLGLAYAFLDRFEVGVRMPLYTQEGDPLGDPQMEFTTSPADGSARGDLAAHIKVRLARAALAGGGSFGLGVLAQVTLPTATDGAFTGVEKPTGRAALLAALSPGAFENRLTLSLNAGGVVRATSRYANLEQASAVSWGAGLQVRALDRVWLAGEIYGDVAPGGRVDEAGNSLSLSPIEWLAGLRWRPDHRVTVGLAAGRGLTRAVGTPALRGVLALSFTPGVAEIRPIRIEPVVVDGDDDGDGVRNSADRCPTEPEDVDLFDDADGCPDPDNDRDGIADALDKCPLDAEDKDGVEDDDGCIDGDNDGDGVPDVADKCPQVAEDKDGFQDLDGCPDDDNDRDGIADGKDKCVTEPETINGIKDEDGCPDKGDSLVVLSPDRIEILDQVQFSATNKLSKRSHNVLGQVAAMLRAHTEIARLRVTCHVQPSANAERDQARSEQRATAIREWLVQWGIDAGRLEIRGFGGARPIMPAAKRGSASVNDRVELIILERK